MCQYSTCAYSQIWWKLKLLMFFLMEDVIVMHAL